MTAEIKEASDYKTLCVAHAEYDCAPCTEIDRGFYPSSEQVAAAEARAEGPVPLLEGSFALFRPPDGSLLLVWRRKGTEEDKYFPIPPFIISAAAASSGKTIDDIIGHLAAGELE